MVVKELLTRGSLTMATIDPLTELQKTAANVLAPITTKLHDYSIKYILPLCEELVYLDNKANEK